MTDHRFSMRIDTPLCTCGEWGCLEPKPVAYRRPGLFSDVYDTSMPGPAFSNGFEGDVWADAWCDKCEWMGECTLMEVAVIGRVPAAWLELDRGSLANRYQCSAWSPIAGYVRLVETIEDAP